MDIYDTWKAYKQKM
jgi:vacuolar protein-sorting-associated protein 4